MRETGRMVPLLGTPKDMICKALGMGVCFHLGNMEVRSSL
jgi:hypothetical protein